MLTPMCFSCIAYWMVGLQVRAVGQRAAHEGPAPSRGLRGLAQGD